jgi:Host cell surface-exposed lipoprotein
MALKPCTECGKEVSTQAPTCPHCGKTDPTGANTANVQKGCLGCAGIIVVLMIIGSFGGGGSDSRIQTQPQSSAAAVGSSTPEPATSGLTTVQRNALRSANNYLKLSGFSRQGLIEQLSSEYGDRYRVADATAAVDRLQVDWNTQAARSAANYLNMSGFSCQGLIDQLSSQYGDKYTVEQATAGARRAGAC